MKTQRGFTLIELMIAIFITALAVAAAYSTFIAQQRSFIVQDQVAETQTSSKIAFDMLVNDLKNAGFGVPEIPNINGVASVITLVNNTGTNNSDTITILGGIRQVATIGLPVGQSTVQVGETILDICNADATTFNIADRRFISFDGITYAEITAIDVAGGNADCNNDGANEAVPRLTLNIDINKPFPAGRPIYLVEDITYAINAAGNLERTGRIGMPTPTVVIANNTDDLQAVNTDVDADGIIRRVRINLLASTARPDQTLDPATKPYAAGIILEDQPAAIGAGDTFRRRIWSTEVAIRNPR